MWSIQSSPVHFLCVSVATLFANQWRKARKNEELHPRVFTISSDSTIFQNYYDEVQELLQSLAGMDELIPGNRLCLYMKTFYSVFIYNRDVKQEQRSGA